MTARRIRAATLGALLLAAFVLLGARVGDEPASVDLATRDYFLGEYREPLGRVAAVAGDILGPVLPALFGAYLLVTMLLRWFGGDRRRAWLLLRIGVVLGLCRLTSLVGKPLFDRERPRVYPDLSYPSGHVVSVASVAVGGALLCVWTAPRVLRWLVPPLVLAVVLAATARVVLGVHWLTDTVGAVLAVGGVALFAAAALNVLPVGREAATARDERRNLEP